MTACVGPALIGPVAHTEAPGDPAKLAPGTLRRCDQPRFAGPSARPASISRGLDHRQNAGLQGLGQVGPGFDHGGQVGVISGRALPLPLAAALSRPGQVWAEIESDKPQRMGCLSMFGNALTVGWYQLQLSHGASTCKAPWESSRGMVRERQDSFAPRKGFRHEKTASHS